MATQNFTIVLARLPTFNRDKSLVVKVFADYGLPLETLGIDLFNIFRKKSSSEMQAQFLWIDMLMMIEDASLDIDIDLLEEEYARLLWEISSCLYTIKIHGSRLRTLQLMDLDTLSLEYVT